MLRGTANKVNEGYAMAAALAVLQYRGGGGGASAPAACSMQEAYICMAWYKSVAIISFLAIFDMG